MYERYLLTAVIIGFSLLAACKQNSGDASRDRDVQKRRNQTSRWHKTGRRDNLHLGSGGVASIPSREKVNFWHPFR